MKIKWVSIIVLLCFFMSSTRTFAKIDGYPPPLWSHTVSGDIKLNMSIRQFDNKIYLKNSGGSVEGRMAVLNDSNGSEVSAFSTNHQSMNWGHDTEVGKDGNIYSLYSDRKAYRLRATDKNGKILWAKDFPEKVDNHNGIAGVFMQSNKTFLVYIRLNTYKYNVYKFDYSGKQLLKKQFNEFINDYQNGYLTTMSSLGTGKILISFYDDNLSFKFKKATTYKIDNFRGITPDGTVYYQGYDEHSNMTTIIARDTRGKNLWKKSISGQAGRDNFYEDVQGFKGYLVIVNKTLYLFNKDGLAAQKTLPDNKIRLNIGQDHSLLVECNNQLVLLSDKLKAIQTINLSERDRNLDYTYVGKGVLYTFEGLSGVVSKIKLTP